MAGQGIVLGYLKFVLGFDSLAFQDGLGDADKRLKAAQRSLGKTADKFKGIGAVLSVGITAPFAALVASSIPAARESAEATGQVQAALTSMGDAAQRTLPQLEAQAKALMRLSTFDDDDIMRKVTANLLTFGNVSGKVFDRAQLAAVNLSARLGQDLQSSAIQLGKALNDPIKGLTALSRVGVSFTAQQQDQIKAMVAAGNAAGAQEVILGELERQFGGSAEAMRKATPGIETQQAWDDFKETIGAIAIKFLPPLSGALAKLLNTFNDMSPGAQKVALAFAAAAAAIGPLSYGIGAVVGAFGALLPVVSKLAPLFAALFSEGALAGGAALLGPIAAAAAAVAAAGYLIYGNWDQIAPVFQEFWDALQKTVGPALVEIVTAAKDAFNEFWNGPLGDGLRLVIRGLGLLYVEYNRVLGPLFIALLKGVAQIVTVVFKQIGDALRFVSQLLRGDWGTAWATARAIVDRHFGGLPSYVIGLMQRMVEGIRNWVVDKLGVIWGTVSEKIEGVKKAFFNLYDAVVGHSYIPDMVDEIGHEMSRLDRNMVKPIEDATKGGADAFASMAQSAMDSLRELSSAIKDGDFIDILAAGANAFATLAGSGAFGSNMQAQANSSSFGGARANGGPVSGGRTYMVGERGPELFTASRSGYIHPNNDNGRGGRAAAAHVIIEEAPGFAARVVGISGNVSFQTTKTSNQIANRRARGRLA
jgi:hypothetical protein